MMKDFNVVLLMGPQAHVEGAAAISKEAIPWERLDLFNQISHLAIKDIAPASET